MERKPKIVLLCGGPFAYRSLSALAYTNYLSGVIIGTSDLQISSMLKSECEKSKIPFLSIESNQETERMNQWLEHHQPDAVFSICFPFRLSNQTLSIHPIKFINFHLGPLPQYRGPMPIFEVFRNQENETAISIHWMTENYDQGALIYVEPLKIALEDNYSTIVKKMAERCSIMVINVAEMLEFGTVIHSQEQDENLAHFYGFPKRNDLFIDWNNMTANEIVALIKACNGWNNGAITYLDNEEIHLSGAEISSEILTSDHNPGTLLKLNNDGSGEIACLENKKIIVKQFGNENGIYSAPFLNQKRIIPGVQFEPTHVSL